MANVTVIGAGVVGLSTALRILQEIPDARVCVIADRFLQETTSHGPAGMFRPTLGLTKVESVEVYRKWCVDSFRWFHTLNQTLDPADTGIIRVSGYQFSDVTEYPFHHDICYNFRELTERELSSCPGSYKYGWFYSTLMMENTRYLPWLTKRIREMGGTFECRKVNSLDELTDTCDVIVNCAGIGNKTLNSDDQVYPVRGHLVRVKAPWVKHFYVFDGGNSYIYPGQNNVVLGGTRQKYEWDTSPASSAWFDDIIERCSKILPGLKNCPVELKWIGLRPHRRSVRVETEVKKANGKRLKIVHNYGHGANGVALSWGTAVDACDHVKKLLLAESQQHRISEKSSKL